MKTTAKNPLVITSKQELTSLLNRTLPSKYSITTISTEYKDAAKVSLAKGLSAEIITRSKKSDVAVLVVEIPKVTQ